jgi:hypothetical protein
MESTGNYMSMKEGSVERRGCMSTGDWSDLNSSSIPQDASGFPTGNAHDFKDDVGVNPIPYVQHRDRYRWHLLR